LQSFIDCFELYVYPVNMKRIMKRIDMYLTEQEILLIEKLSGKTGLNRSELIRRAVDEYLKQFSLEAVTLRSLEWEK